MKDSNKYTAEEYLEETYNYYDTKAVSNKRWYTTLVIIDTVISAFIPFATLFMDSFSSIKYIIAFMGSIATILSTLKATFAFQKNWVGFRTTSEILKFHRYLYKTKSSPYDEDNRDHILISNIHSIIETENKNWRSLLLNNPKVSKSS
ncbi:DUF4231 domain-containing protein [Clostridium sp. 19966]|uniref:DUF4231 domain-containing protein n=1 Tax=Clostridium sp. 19966 TaxID=2768166 RepID=UPI0028DFAEB6|nr:DUF4231 domain-containing protein [Clostridium sp. 19966]MDT8717771.1 DUF4231 domain-containing protein [Clostridium sp. 19966]